MYVSVNTQKSPMKYKRHKKIKYFLKDYDYLGSGKRRIFE